MTRLHRVRPLSPAARIAALALTGILAGAGCAVAEEPFSFATTPGKLPKTVVPVHYAIALEPNLETLELAGSEVIDVEVAEPTARVVLNAVNMTIDKAFADARPDAPANVVLDAAAQTATLTFPGPLAPGPHKLSLVFTAHINKFWRGLFVTDYPTDQGGKRMISSHLEPSDARRIFPGWDEPAFKASFELAVTVPQAFLAVSNMPVAREEPVGGAAKRVSFAPTPKMSSYLFVLAAGELERLSGEVDGIDVGVVTTRGKRQNGRFALDSALGLLTYFNDYFGAKYPLPKLDLIAVPGGFGGAMENWGGITFFESRLLFDPAATPPALQREIYNILAHEMAHQWFGDLVTMAWWDNLWLNEGFASWMQVKAAEHFHPDWQVWLNGNDAKQYAMGEDARRTTHPIQQPVADESEAMAIFDAITYSKGQAFIRMLENFLGEDVFRAGIRRYMHDHAFSSTTTADLWRALEAASGKPVTALAAAYTEQPGVPLVVGEAVCRDGRQRIMVRTERFTVHDPNARPLQWPVPIAVGGPGRPSTGETVLVERPTAELDGGSCGDPVKLNLGDVGYYRVQYDAALLGRLAATMRSLSAADRVNLLADSFALVESARIPPEDFLDLVDRVGSDDERAVWEQVIRMLGRIDRLERGRPQRAAFQAYARAKLRPVFDRLGWDRAAGDSNDAALLRTRLIRTLGELGDTAINAEARRRFAAFVEDRAALSPDLREPVTFLAGREADRATYDVLLGLARRTTSTEERVRFYSALASARDRELAAATLPLALADATPNNLVGGLISSVAFAGEHPDLALGFVQANFSALTTRLGPPFRIYFVSNLMPAFPDRARARELENFAPVHETAGGRMVAARSIESIQADADFREESLPAIDRWVERHARQPKPD